MLAAVALLFLTGCAVERGTPPRLRIANVVSSATPIEPEKPLPLFSLHFDEGVKALYTYVWFRNVATMTGGFPVHAQWFSRNDFTPPIAMHSLTMTPPQSIAQFSFHDESGIESGPYEIRLFAGEPLAATGSAKFFVGMTPEEIRQFLAEEDAFRKRMAEERRRRGEEEKIGTGALNE